MRDAVKEVGGAVERIDDPARLVGSPAISPPSSSSRPQSGRALRNSSTMVCSARLSAIDTKSPGPFSNLQLLDLAEIAAQPRRRLADGAGHDSDQAGV